MSPRLPSPNDERRPALLKRKICGEPAWFVIGSLTVIVALVIFATIRGG